MPDLHFNIEGACPVARAAIPTLALQVRLTNAVADETIHSSTLRCQIQIETTRRTYSETEQARLHDLFGSPDRWGQTLRAMLWTQVGAVVPSFTGDVLIDIHVPCSYDFNLAATKYFDGLQEGDIPLCLLFSGTLFYAGAGGLLQVAQVPWDNESKFRLPASVWREMMQLYHPDAAYLRLPKDMFDRLLAFKRRSGAATLEDAIEQLLDGMEAAT